MIASWRSAFRGLLPAEYLDGLSLDERTATWQARLIEPGNHVIVTEDTEGVCGFCSYGYCRDADVDCGQIGEIRTLYIHPRAWRGGRGRRLCERALAALCAAGFRAVTLWVARGNPNAQAFYRTLGFADDGGRKTMEAGAVIEHLRFRWHPPENFYPAANPAASSVHR